jgi:two-component system, cell cycle sensor histidine kinase and response regulator CckA
VSDYLKETEPKHPSAGDSSTAAQGSSLRMEDDAVREEDVFIHDLKNILLGIVGNLSLAGATVSARDPAYRFILSASQSASRACRFAEEWIRNRHRSLGETAPVFLPDLIRDCFEICEVADRHRFRLTGSKSCPVIQAHAHHLRQVFNNILSNAIQSTPEGGRIQVNLRKVSSRGRHFPSELDTSGGYLLVRVEDDGPGIPEEIRQHLFSPGFSTKKSGCGVGLAGARQIMRNCGGTITLGNGKLPGACILAWIPLLERRPAGPVHSPAINRHPEQIDHLREPSVLVMDDEPMVREVLGEMLIMLGFIPHFAESGKNALDLFKERLTARQPFAFVILDLNLPGGVGGEQIIQHLLQLDPQTKAVVTSGLTSNHALRNYSDYGFCACLPKPYSIADLLLAVDKTGVPLPQKHCPNR